MNPWVIVGVGIAWFATLAGVGAWQHKAGRVDERVIWQAKESADLAAANDKIKQLTDDARAQEAAHQARLADIGANIVQENARHEAELRRAAAGARPLVLRNQPACPPAGGGAEGPPVAGAGGGDASAACELPAAAVRDLLQLVLDADRDVRLLGRAQAVIEEDRRVCGIHTEETPQ